MDPDSMKLFFPLIAGFLGLMGGMLSFINGRLNDAKTDDAKNKVYQKTYDWIATALFVSGTVVSAFGQFYAIGCIFYVIAFIIQTYLFLSRQHSVSRIEIVMHSLQTSITISLLVLSFVFSMFSRILTVQERKLDFQTKAISVLGEKPKP